MKRVSKKIVYHGKWLAVQETIYRTPQGQELVWESINRKRCGTGVVVLAKLKPSNRFVLIRQYRAAVHGYVLGLPAGLAYGDPHHALVELKEETGYTGKIARVSPVLKTGSTITNESGLIVCVEVDEKAPANKNPIQELEAGEDIEVFLVKKEKVLAFLKAQQKKGTHISSVLWYLFGLNDWI